MSQGLTEKSFISYQERLKNIANSVFDPYSNLNIDALLDCYNALNYEINVKSLNNNKNLKSLFSRISPTADHIEKSRINLNDFSIIKVLGKGAFGQVSLAKHNETNSIFALKAMNKVEMIKREEACCLWEEREIMALSETDWVVKGGDLVNFMSTYDIDETIARFYLAEVCVALDFLHNLGFIHRDVKPDNMLLDKKGHVKLCDFGTCIRMDKNGKVSSNVAVGTPDYISPEVLSSQSATVTYGREADWWSVGVFVYEFIVGDTPFYAQSLVGTYSNIMNYKNTLSIPEDVEMSPEYESLIRSFLCEPDKRIGRDGISDIKPHPFFKGVKWDNLRNMTPPIVPSLAGELDTSCFEDLEEAKPGSSTPIKPDNPLRGDHFPFVGFSYNRDFKHVAPSSQPAPTVTKVVDTSVDNAKIVQYLKEIDELKSVVTQKDKQLLESDQIIRTNKNHYEELELRFKNVSKQNSVTGDLRDENNKLLVKLQQMETQVSDISQELKKMEVSLKFSKMTENETKTRYEDLLTQMIPLKEQVETLKMDKGAIDSEYQLLKDKLKITIDNYNNTNNNYERLKTEFDDLSVHISKLKSLFETESTEELMNRIAASRVENSNLKTKINSYENDIKSYEDVLKKQSSITDVENMQLARKYNLAISERDSLITYIEQMEVKSKELTDKCDKMAKQIRILTNENISIENKLKEMTSKYAVITMSEGRLVKERGDLNDKYKDIATQLEKANLQLRSAELKASQFEEQISYNEVRINSQNQQIEALQAQAQKNEQMFINLKSEMHDLTFRNTQLETNIVHKQDEVSTLRKQISILETENTSYKVEIEHLKSIPSPAPVEPEESLIDEMNLVQLAEIHRLTSELEQSKEQYEALKRTSEKQLETERIRKNEAIRKLDQVMSMAGGTIGAQMTLSKKEKASSKSDRKIENLYKQLQMDYQKETERHAGIVKDFETKVFDLNNMISDLQTQIEELKTRRSQESANAQNRYGKDNSIPDGSEFNFDNDSIIKQSFLSLPAKSAKSSRKLVWNRVVATLTSKSLSIYKDADISPENLQFCINIDSIYYVRPISQNDLIRSTANDIIKIFQIIYNDDTMVGDVQQTEVSGEKCIIISNHCFVNIQYHMPTTCDVCGKGLWGFIKSSFALECKNCHYRCHKEHANDPKSIACCPDYDKRRIAKEIMLMATSAQEQQRWIEIIISLMKSIVNKPSLNRAGSVLSKASCRSYVSHESLNN